MKRSSWLTVAAGAAAAALVLSGCGSAGTTAKGASPDDTAAAKAVVDKLEAEVSWPKPAKLSKPIDLHGKTIWFVPISNGVPAIHAAGIAFTQAVRAAGGSVKMCDGQFNPSDMGNCLKSAADQRADAVVTYFIDYSTIPNAFKALTDKGIPVLAGAAQAVRPATKTLAFWDNSAMTTGQNETVAAGALVAGGSSPNGIAMLLHDTPTTTTATKAMVSKWKQLCSGCAISTIDFTSANMDKLPSQISAELLKNPQANVILSPNDTFVPSITQALKIAGRTNIKVVSSSGDLANMQMVKSDSQYADVGFSVAYAGWSLANGLFQLVEGEKVTNPVLPIRYFDPSNIKDLSLTPSAYQAGAWYGDDSYIGAYKSAWGIG